MPLASARWGSVARTELALVVGERMSRRNEDHGRAGCVREGDRQWTRRAGATICDEPWGTLNGDGDVDGAMQWYQAALDSGHDEHGRPALTTSVSSIEVAAIANRQSATTA